jgi:hypothetical protein
LIALVLEPVQAVAACQGCDCSALFAWVSGGEFHFIVMLPAPTNVTFWLLHICSLTELRRQVMCHASNLKWRDRTGVLVLLLLLTSQRATAQGRLYWTEPDNLTVMSSNFDGSATRTEVQGHALDVAFDIEEDQETGWVYWTKWEGNSSGAVARSSPDGRDGGVIVRNLDEPRGIALDGLNGHIYWAEYSRIRRARLDGSDTVDVITGIESGLSLEISVEDNLMFWTASGGTYRSKLDGTDIQHISDAGADWLGGNHLGLGAVHNHVAVDAGHKMLYVAAGKTITGMEFDGAAIDTVVNAEFEIYGLEVEPAAERLCWTETDWPLGATPLTKLMCAATDGSATTKILDRSGVTIGLAINQKSRMIHTIDRWAGRLWRCRYDGTGVEDLSHPVFYPVDVAVDPVGMKIYSVDGGLHPRSVITATDFGGAHYAEILSNYRERKEVTPTVAVDAVHKNLYLGTKTVCGPATVLLGPMEGPIDNVFLADLEYVTDFELDPNNGRLYYTGPGQYGTGVWANNLDGSAEVKLTSSSGLGIALSQRHLYWLDGSTNSIRRGNLDGTEPVDVLGGVESIRDLAVDASDRYLFWSTPGENTIKRLEIGQSTVHEIVTADVGIGGLFVVSAPSNVTQIAPLNGAADLPTTVSLTWSRPPDAQRFDVQVASGANINDIVFAQNTPHNEATFVAPVAESSYYWRVRSSGVGGYSPFTGYARFTVGGSGPLAATLLEPAEGEAGVAIDPTFRWTKAPEAVYHQIQVADNSSFADPLIDVDSLSDDYFVGATLSHETTYYWRVAGIAADGKYTFSAPRSFTTIIAAPESITLVSPDASEEGVPAYATFMWQAASDADSYRFELASDSLFEQLLIDIETPATAYALETPLAYDTRYFWRVCGVNEGGEGVWSEQRAFRTVIGTGVGDDGLPSDFALGQNFPNPFSLSTQIRYDVPHPEHVSIVVFDALGRQVERLVDSAQPVGTHAVTFDAADRPVGLYFYRMRAGSFEHNRTMVVAK